MIELLKDCIEANGKLYCYDCVASKYYQFDKKELTAAQIPNDTFDKLLRKIADKVGKK